MYSSDHHFPGLVHAWPVTATIASGTVTNIDTSVAEKMPGVLAVYTHENIGPLYRTPPSAGVTMLIDERRPPLEDTTIRYYGQYVAVVVAQTVEQARAAAEAVKVSLQQDSAQHAGRASGRHVTIMGRKTQPGARAETGIEARRYCRRSSLRGHQARCRLLHAHRNAQCHRAARLRCRLQER